MESYTGRSPSKPTGNASRRKSILIGCIVCVLIGAIFIIFTAIHPPSNYRNVSRHVTTLANKNKTLTTANIASLNARSYLESVMYTMALQPVQHLVQENAQMTSANTTPPNFGAIQLSDTTYDYATRTLALTRQSKLNSQDQNDSYDRCSGGKTYSYFDSHFGLISSWQQENQDYCNPSSGSVASLITDGMNTGGLSKIQAENFVQFIFQASPRSLIKNAQATLATHDNKQYIKLTASIAPAKIVVDGASQWNGMQYILDAFQKTGLDATRYPYFMAGVPSSGRAITMYVDPLTTLPVYAEYVTDTGLDDKSGQPQPATSSNMFSLQRVQYTFGGVVPTNGITTAPAPIAISWPPENR